MLCVASTLCGQDAVSELKKQAFANLHSEVNQSLLSMLHNMPVDAVEVLLFEEWQPLAARGQDMSLTIDSANFHLEHNMILFIWKGELFMLDPSRVECAQLGQRRFLSMRFAADRQTQRGFFEVLEEGAMTLLRRHELVRKIINYHPVATRATREEVVEPGSELFYHRSGSRFARLLPRKKRAVITLFRRHRDAMIDYARRHRLSVHRDADMRALFGYYNATVGGSTVQGELE